MNENDNSMLLKNTSKNLEKNGFMVYLAKNTIEAKSLFHSVILQEITPKTVSYADSITLKATNILEELKQNKHIDFIETFDKKKTWDENIEQRKKALSVDLFLTGSNAITEKGQIINLDMIGNRINGIVFGPKNVVLVVGVNKIVKTIEEGMKRIKEISAPQNAIRHKNFDLPCQKTGYCVDCYNDQRICNTWSIIEKCFPKKRIRIIMINEVLGI